MKGQSDFATRETEFQKGATRPERAKKICEIIKYGSVKNWFGVVDQLSTNSEGKGILVVKIAKDVYVQTWNNAFSDLVGRTMIDPDEALYKTLLHMKVGQDIRFAGRFLQSEIDCVQEISFTLSGSMTKPQFIMQFSDIRPVD